MMRKVDLKMIILTILGVILLIVIVIIMLIIITPYTYIVEGDNIEGFGFEFSVLIFFKKLGFTYRQLSSKEKQMTINIFNFSKKISDNHNKEQKPKKIKKAKDKKSKKKKTKKKRIMSRINKKIIKNIINMIQRILKEISPKRISIDAKIGFEDPMYTGLIYGLYSEFSYFLKKWNMLIDPVFNDEIFKFNFSIAGRIRIYNIIFILLKFIFSSPIRKEIILIIKEKKGGVNYAR